MNLSRRGFLGGLSASIIAAPAIVRSASLMPVRTMLVRPAPFSLESLLVQPIPSLDDGGFIVSQEYCAELMKMLGFMTVNEVRAIEGLPPMQDANYL